MIVILLTEESGIELILLTTFRVKTTFRVSVKVIRVAAKSKNTKRFKSQLDS